MDIIDIIKIATPMVLVIGFFFTLKSKAENNASKIDEVDSSFTKFADSMRKELKQKDEKILELNLKVENAPSMQQVDNKFLTKEFFKQHEKHIDSKFADIEKKLIAGFTDIKDMLKNTGD
jgi:uncharacterized membrane protein YgaE (UPF0421/DUF939 family)